MGYPEEPNRWVARKMSVLVLIGSGILLLLGVVHAVLTIQSTPEGGPMMPTNPETRAAMSVVGGLGIAPDLATTLWKAWIGFNLSHSLGMVMVGLIIGFPVASNGAIPAGNMWWLGCALILPWVYLWLSVRYWFSKPTQGIAVAAVLILAGTIGQLALT